ncbi:MAG: hypothetical protein V2I33_23330 [Kangiellaceae bacterium]|jgi:hypothetical protein|nr:hypothetical protein [Kangiellaceae bacterium]
MMSLLVFFFKVGSVEGRAGSGKEQEGREEEAEGEGKGGGRKIRGRELSGRNRDGRGRELKVVFKNVRGVWLNSVNVWCT